MENKVHTFKLNIDWELIRLISQIDRFDASWTSIEKKEGRIKFKATQNNCNSKKCWSINRN